MNPNAVKLAVLLLVAVPNVVFSVACILPGCGGGAPAPEEVQPDVYAPDLAEPSDAETVDTASPELHACADLEPAVAIRKAGEDGQPGEPLGDEIAFVYGGSCGDAGGTLAIDISPEGLAPGAAEVRWTVSVDGETPIENQEIWELSCGEDGAMPPGRIYLDLPLSADGAAVSIDVALTDALGVQVSAEHTFIASVEEEEAP